jgi:hypothetical protein
MIEDKRFYGLESEMLYGTQLLKKQMSIPLLLYVVNPSVSECHNLTTFHFCSNGIPHWSRFCLIMDLWCEMKCSPT